jgi:sortase (surface protein transpeptidase)
MQDSTMLKILKVLTPVICEVVKTFSRYWINKIKEKYARYQSKKEVRRARSRQAKESRDEMSHPGKLSVEDSKLSHKRSRRVPR